MCDPAKARERLGFEARTPLADSIARAAAWYRAARLALTAPPSMSERFRDGRRAGGGPSTPLPSRTGAVYRGYPMMAETRRAAFFDVDGTLVRTNIVHAYAYLRDEPGVRSSGIAWQTLRDGRLACPLFGALDLVNRKVFNEFFYRYYAGPERGPAR